MKRWLLGIGVFLACSTSEHTPKNILPKEKFEEVLAASLLIEARLNHEMVVDQRADSPIARYYTELFREQGVSEADFKATYAYYTARPEEMKRIYEDVLNDLQQRADTARH